MEKEAELRAENAFGESVRIRRCNYWHPPVGLNYKSASGCKCGDNCVSRHTEVDGSIARSFFKSVNLMSAIRALPDLRKERKTKTLQQEGCARRVAWNLAKRVYKLQNTGKASFYSPIEARAIPAPTSKKSEEREFVVDSGASMHMLSKMDLSSEELETL